MNLLAIVGSPRKGKATDTLVDKAIEGAKAKHPDCRVKKIHLMDHNIQFCKNCLVCRDSKTDKPYSRCTIRDDMDWINEELLKADALIMATPVHEGYVTGIMATFLERIIWTFAKPEGRALTLTECPTPRSKEKKRKAIIIVTSGIIPPIYRRFCDWATPRIRDNIKYSLHARTVGDMYAGAIQRRGVEYYFKKAYKLGRKLGKTVSQQSAPADI
ncbi:flavodoxin family protein [Gemmatimonadota bacterium]